MARSPEEILAEQATEAGSIEEVRDVSTEDIAAAEEGESGSDAFSDADERTERMELRNDSIDNLVEQAQNTADEGIDTDEHDRG